MGESEENQGTDERQILLLNQIADFKERISNAIQSSSTALAPSFGLEYIKLLMLASVIYLFKDTGIFNEIIFLKSEMSYYPTNIPKNDPLIQLKWLQNSITQLDVITKQGFVNTLSLPETEVDGRVLAASGALFNNKHYSEAIFAAFKALEQYVREKASLQNEYGTRLMAHVFNENTPILKIKCSHDMTAAEEQEGFKFLFMGAMLAIKDPKSHINIEQNDKTRTFQYLAFVSLLFKTVDDATLVTQS